jgi:predicted enzyme related to lactoylglutathione lyase
MEGGRATEKETLTMAVVTAHTPSTFCWSDLGTPDAAGAKQFYGTLFGWNAEDRPMGPEGVYSMMQVGGHDAAALYSRRAGDAPAGAPPRWQPYVAVANAEEAARRVSDAGGEVLAAPFDVFDAGRMAVIKDPTGAALALWQARQHIGAAWVEEPGGLAWAELLTSDTATAAQFYARVFGWAAEAQSGPIPYTVFKLSGRQVGGMATLPEPVSGPPCWNLYFSVADCDRAVEQAVALGGRVLRAAAEIPAVGRNAALADPQGAAFSIMTYVAPAPT